MAGVIRALFIARSSALAAALVIAPVAILVSAPPASADVPITSVCATTTAGSTITLTANCATTQALTIPDGFTLNGGGNTITANNPTPTPTQDTYIGAVVTNAAGSTSMNIENLTITGPPGGFLIPVPAISCNSPFPGLFGIYFNDASGSVNNVEVLNMFQTRTPNSPACGVGHGIRADGVTAARTVTITDTEVSNFQKAGLFASGNMTMNVSASTVGPPSSVPFSIAQNSVTWTNTSTNSNPPVGAGGTMTDSTIIGGSFSSTGPVDPASNASTAVLLFGSNNVTIDSNEIRGSDLGISVTAGSTNSTIAFNAINRPEPPTPDPYGIGVSVDEDLADTTVDEALADTTDLICNTFDGWNSDIDGDIQIACPLPDGAECEAYSATSTVIGGIEPFTWALVSGDLPDGVSLAPNGEITGTLPDGSAGNYDVTLGVTDADGLTATSDQVITIAPGCASPSPTPSPTASTGPIGGGQPAGVPTAVAAGVPTTAGPDRQQSTTGADLTLLSSGAALLAAAAALSVIGGLRRRARRH